MQASAPAPPIEQRYMALFLTIASLTAILLSPFPIIPPSPKSKRRGANLSILPDVVGPHEPIGLPSGAGVGPA